MSLKFVYDRPCIMAYWPKLYLRNPDTQLLSILKFHTSFSLVDEGSLYIKPKLLNL